MSNKLILDVLNGENTRRVPVWLMRQAGRYLPEYHNIRKRYKSFLALCYDPIGAAEVTLQPIKRFSMDGAIIFSDILVVADALGCKVEFINGQGPRLRQVKSSTDLCTDNIKKCFTPVMQTIQRVKTMLTHDKTLIGFAGAPWTVAVYMLEGVLTKNFVHVQSFMYSNEIEFNKIIALLIDVTIEYLSEQIRNGAEVIQIFDSHAGILSVDNFKKWVIEPTQKIVAELNKRFPHIPIIGFPRNAGVMYMNYVKDTRVNAISVDQHLPLQWIRDNLQNLAVVQGNLDAFLLAYSKKDFLRKVDGIITTLQKNRLIFNLGHGVIPQTPIEHVTELVAKIKHEYQ